MKDLTITKKRQKTEIVTLLACFVVAFAFNIYAIIEYKAPVKEIATSIFYVLTFAIVLYVAWTILRILFYIIKYALKKK